MATRGWEDFTEADAKELDARRSIDLRRAEKARGRPQPDARGAACMQGHHALCNKVGCQCLCHDVTVKPSKMRNVRTLVHDIWFDSRAEAEYWLYLKARERKGEIRNLEHHKAFPLCCPSKDRTTEHEVSSYEADFVYEEREAGGWVRHVIDKKGGVRTRMYLLKRKWMELQHGIVVEEV
jgi:hypothetical protein